MVSIFKGISVDENGVLLENGDNGVSETSGQLTHNQAAISSETSLMNE
jgi:hypothetical protein